MTKVAAWLGVRLDRIARRWDRFAETVSARWYRSLDRIADRWDRFAETVSAPWYRSLDRIAGRWDRFAQAASVGWERVTWRGHARRRHHGESERRWFGFVDRIGDFKERLTESFSVGWDRLTHRYRGRRVRTARSGGEQSRRRVADWIVAGALTVIVGLASMATLSALRDAEGERSAANTDLSGPGGSSDRAVEGPGGTGAAPEERPPTSDGSGTPLGAFRVYQDERTGYRFSYPSGWEVSASEGITRLVDSAGEIIISFRTAPSGSIEDFSERLVGILASRYAPLDLVAREEGETPQGESSLVLGGNATDIDGSSIRFMIVTIEGPDRNRAITVRFSADSDLLDVSSSIRRIVGSFTTSALATAT
jgi:hypothetical protein